MKHKIHFHLGLNTKVVPRFLKDGECSIAQDCYFDEYGNIFSRKFKINHLVYDRKICSIFPYSDKLFVNADGALYLDNTYLGSGYGSTPFNHVEYNGVLYAANRLKKIRFNGSEVHNIGNSAPTLKPIANAGAAGNPNGTYYYKYRYEDLYSKESNSSPLSESITVTSDQISVLISPSSNEKISYINIYRNKNGGTDYYYVDRVLNETAKTSTSLSHVDVDYTVPEIYFKTYYKDDIIYAACGAGGVATYTRDADGVLTYVDVDDQGGVYYDVFHDGSFLYVAAGSLGILTYSVDASGNLTYIDADVQGGGDYRAVYKYGNFIYAACDTNNRIYVYTVDGSGNLTYKNSQFTGNPKGVFADQSFVYVSTSSDLLVYEVDSEANFTYKDGDSLGFVPGDVWHDGTFLFLACGTDGLYSYSVDQNGQMSLLDTDDQGGTYRDVWSDGNFIYCARGTSGLSTYTVDESGVLTHIDADDQGNIYYGVFGDGTYIYTARYTSGLSSYKVGYTYTDNIADSDLSTLITDNVNDPPPDNLYYITEHYERLIGARTELYPNSIWYTKEFEPEYWGDGTSQQYLLGDTEYSTGIISWGRYVVYFKEKDIYIMEGTDPATWYRRRSDASKGNISPYCLAFWKLPIFCSYDGLYFFDANIEINFSDKVESFFEGENLKNAVGYVYNNKYYFSYNNQTLVYDLLNKIFYTYNFGMTAMAKDSGVFYAGVGDNIVKIDQDLNDDSESIDFKLKSRAIELNTDGQTGYLKDYTLDINTKSEDVTFNVYIDDSLKQTITLNTDSMTTLFRNFNSHLKGRYAEFEFVYSGTQKIEINPPLCLNKLDK